MSRFVSIWVASLCLFSISLNGEEMDWQPLDVSSPSADWQALFAQMHAVERVAAPFEELRTFTFRKEPKRYRGVFRKEADGRVSLAYTEPEAMVLHIGEGFAYYRKGDGAIRRILNSNTRSDALALMPRLFNFDLVPIAGHYEISGRIDGEAWHLLFSAKAADDLPYQRMLVSGRGSAVERIKLSKSETQQVVIEMGDPVYPEFYLSGAKAAYFFEPRPE